MIAAEYIVKYPGLFLNKDYSQLDIFIKNELIRSNKHLKKIIIECIEKNLFYNEKFFKLIQLIKTFDVDPDNAFKIMKSKVKICFRDEFSSIQTQHLWLDYYLLNERPGIGPFVISYEKSLENHPEFEEFMSFFENYTEIESPLDELKQDNCHFRSYYKIENIDFLKKIKEVYIHNYDNTLIFFKENDNSTYDNSHVRLELINNLLFLNIPNKCLIKFSELKNKSLPPKEWKNISGYNLKGKYIFDLEQDSQNFPDEIKKKWDYYSFFVQQNIRIDTIKKIKEIYSSDRINIMLKNDFYNVNINQMSIFLNKVIQNNQLSLLPKKPKSLTDLETNLMLLQLQESDFVNYLYPSKILKLDEKIIAGHKVYLPKNRKDLINASKLMKNCLYEVIWNDKILQNKEFIIILLKENKPEIAVSFDLDCQSFEALRKCNQEIDGFYAFEILANLNDLLK